MDDCLPLGSLDAATLRMLLEKERQRRTELEQEVARLQSGLARQNAVIARLEQQNAQLRWEQQELRTLVAGLTEQNALLRQQVAQLREENTRLRGRSITPAPAPEIKPATPQREKTPRKKRAAEHNRGWRLQERASRWETHAADQCPRCGEQLSGGWIVRRVPVIDLPPVAPLEVTEHRMIRRQCPRCGARVVPSPAGQDARRIGRCRFGPRLIAALVVMATVERLPLGVIQERLRREYGLAISQGGIVGLLQRMATAGRGTYEQMQQEVRASPAVHADETSWRENGQHPQRVPSAARWPAEAIWTVSSARTIYVHHGRRTKEEIDGILGADFAGTIVADCYAAYDHFEGPKQRCWAHLVRELKTLRDEHPEQPETSAWVEGVLAVYEQARAPRPPPEEGATSQAARAREQRAQRYEALIQMLCPAQLDPTLPHATLAQRLRKYLAELFTFVRDPQVPATNNAAERSLRPLVIARKVSGGTRSAKGSTTRMILYSLCSTARLQGHDPAAICQEILLAPPDAPSPLAPR